MIRDASGFLSCAWFNQPYLARVFKRGQFLIVHGKVQPYGRGPLQMQVKDYELVEEGPDETLHTGRLVPVYPTTEGLTQRPLRRLMKRLVDGWADQVEDPLPSAVREKIGLPSLGQAIRGAHFPETDAVQALAQDSMRSLFEQLKQQYDFIIVDSCPVLPVADALLLGQHVDGVIFSILRDVSRTPAVYAAQQKISSLAIRILGAVMIGASSDVGSAGYAYAGSK